MATFYWVDPADTSSIIGQDGVGYPGYTEGVTYTYPDGGRFAAGHQPQWNVYEAIPDSTRPGEWEYFDVPKYNLAFVGTVQDGAARVQETANIAQRSSQEIYEGQIVALGELFDSVLVQGVNVSLAAGDKAISTEPARTTYYTLAAVGDGASGKEFEDTDLWGDPYVYRKNELDTMCGAVSELYRLAIVARDGHTANLDALLTADNAAGLAAYDISTGWPPAPIPPAKSATARLTVGRNGGPRTLVWSSRLAP